MRVGGGSFYSKRGARRQLPKLTRLPDMTLDLVRSKGFAERKNKGVLICFKDVKDAVVPASFCLDLIKRTSCFSSSELRH